MGCHMGLARVMETLGLLCASTKGTESGSKVSLGHGNHRKQYILAYDKGLLQKFVKDFGHVHIAVDGNLTNDILFAIVDQMIALFEPGLAVPASTKPVQLPMVCKKPASASTTGKGAVPSLASGGITKKLPYNTLHYMCKHLFWLICVHEQANSCQIDWRAVSLWDMAKPVPDEIEQLQTIGWEVLVVAVSQCLGTHPMMVSCQLCLTHRVLNEPKMLQIFSDACNQEKLAQLKQHHVDAYGIPASPWQLARDFEIAASKKSIPIGLGGCTQTPSSLISSISPRGRTSRCRACGAFGLISLCRLGQ